MSGSVPQSDFLAAKAHDATLKAIQAPVRDELDRVQQEIAGFFTTPSRLLQDLAGHVLNMPGKKLRPMLLLLVAGLEGKPTPDAIQAAAMVELVHTATLIHDDSIDRSLVRRGLPTINSLWSDRISVILGDYLYTKAFHTLVASGNSGVVEVMSRTAHRMTVGEMLGMEQKDDLDVTEEDYLRLISEKTASLISASCEIGAMLGNGDPKRHGLFRDFGQDLGMAFQITDDLLDFTGDAGSLGKQIGSDLTEGKITLPIVHALQDAPDPIRALVANIVKGRGAAREDWTRLTTYLHESGAFDYCRARAEAFAQRAEARLEACPDGRFKDTLVLTVKFTTQRCH